LLHFRVREQLLTATSSDADVTHPEDSEDEDDGMDIEVEEVD
jgi:hypothetical protein